MDSAYNSNWIKFIDLTNKLTTEKHKFDKLTKKKQRNLVQDSINLHAHLALQTLRILDTIGFSLNMAAFFTKGKFARSQDLTSPVAQLQCSYDHYMQTLRKSGDNVLVIVTAALTLESHLKTGFPASIFCPFLYDEVKFGPGLEPTKPLPKKIILPDSLRKEN